MPTEGGNTGKFLSGPKSIIKLIYIKFIISCVFRAGTQCVNEMPQQQVGFRSDFVLFHDLVPLL